MKRNTATVGVLVFAFTLLTFTGRSQSEVGDHYVFSGGYLMAEYKSGFLPVLSGDKKGVYIETEKGVKRVRYSNECRLVPNDFISDKIVKILDSKFGFDNLRQSQLETNAMSESMRNEVGTQAEIILKGGGIAGAPTEGLSEERQAEIDALKKAQEDHSNLVKESLEDDAYTRGELSDLINVKLELLSEWDLENVYCVMVVNYLRRSGPSFNQYSKSQIVRMKKIGHLAAGISSKVKFAYKLPEGYVNEHGIELVLFTGDGKPLATDQSRNLRRMTMAELENSQSQY